jgi:hypothetical protein
VVVCALKRLGCEVFKPATGSVPSSHIWVVRGAARIFAIPKFDIVPISIQRDALKKLEFSQDPYIGAVAYCRN